MCAVIRVLDDLNYARPFLSSGCPRTYTQSSSVAGAWHFLQSVLKSVARLRAGSFALNKAQPDPFPYRWLLGSRPFESLIITGTCHRSERLGHFPAAHRHCEFDRPIYQPSSQDPPRGMDSSENTQLSR